ncbi:MAG: TonB family protein [Candidatus Baltobacteraceae bacterium]
MLATLALLTALSPSPVPSADGPCAHAPLPSHITAVEYQPGLHPKRPYAALQFSIDPNGRVVALSIVDSTDDQAADAAALRAAKEWSFLPATANCSAISGIAVYVVALELQPHSYHGALDFQDPCNHDARAVTVVTPEEPRRQVPSLTAIVRIKIDQSARLIEVSTLSSTGRADLDRLAEQAASFNAYAPRVFGCVATHGTYVVRENF